MALRWRSGLESCAPRNSVQQDNKELFYDKHSNNKSRALQTRTVRHLYWTALEVGQSIQDRPRRQSRTVIEKYRAYILGHPALLPAVQSELKGKVVGCWCAPQSCHGDVLAEVAES